MNTIEAQATSLARSTNDFDGNVSAAVEAGKRLISGDELDTNNDTYFAAAQCIVEPAGIDEEYYEFMDEDQANWISFVREMCGTEWGELAQVVSEYGY